jgi:periplasmic divalent cation tolerance protein
MSDTQTSAIVVFVTAPNREEAVRLAEMIVGARLAACVQILPEMESIYRWNGTIQREGEHLIIAKTTLDNFDLLESEVRALHSYSVPEIVAIPALAISMPYFEWLNQNVIHPKRKARAVKK